MVEVRTPRVELVVTRVVDAPPGLAWKNWTDPECVRRWWGPKDFTSPFCRIDLREGGTYLYCMRGPNGRDYWSTGVYREVVPQERIVSIDSFADRDGRLVPASYYGLSGDYPMKLPLTVTFQELQGKTRLTVQHAGHPTGAGLDRARTGWNQSLDRFAAMLSWSNEE